MSFLYFHNIIQQPQHKNWFNPKNNWGADAPKPQSKRPALDPVIPLAGEAGQKSRAFCQATGCIDQRVNSLSSFPSVSPVPLTRGNLDRASPPANKLHKFSVHCFAPCLTAKRAVDALLSAYHHPCVRKKQFRHWLPRGSRTTPAKSYFLP